MGVTKEDAWMSREGAEEGWSPRMGFVEEGKPSGGRHQDRVRRVRGRRSGGQEGFDRARAH